MHDGLLGTSGAQDVLLVHTNLVRISHSFHLTHCRNKCRVQTAVCRPSIILSCAVYAARPGKRSFARLLPNRLLNGYHTFNSLVDSASGQHPKGQKPEWSRLQIWGPFKRFIPCLVYRVMDLPAFGLLHQPAVRRGSLIISSPLSGHFAPMFLLDITMLCVILSGTLRPVWLWRMEMPRCQHFGNQD